MSNDINIKNINFPILPKKLKKNKYSNLIETYNTYELDSESKLIQDTFLDISTKNLHNDKGKKALMQLIIAKILLNKDLLQDL